MITYAQTGVAAGLRTAALIGITVAGGIATLFTITAFFGTTWWLFDYAANFRWQMFWLLIAAAILYTFMSSSTVSILFILAAVVNAWFIAPLWLGSQPEPIGSFATTVVHVDVYPNVDDAGVVSKWLVDTGADILLVSGTTARRMEAVTDGNSPYSIIAAPQAIDRIGIVVLSLEPWPVEEILTAGFAETVYRITVGTGENATDIVASWGSLGSNLQNAERLGARFDAIAQAVASATNPVTVIGNLGATRWTNDMTVLRESHGLRDATEGRGYAPTWPLSGVPIIGNWIGIPVDVILMTNDLTPRKITTGPDIGAGHLPLYVEISRAATS